MSPHRMDRPSLLGTVTLLLACCLLFFGRTAYAQTLVLAQISDRPKKDYRQLRPMADHIVQAMAPFGFRRAEVRLYPDLPAFEQAIRNGQVHWITETPLTAARLYQHQLAIPVARKWKRGQQTYQSLIYVAKDSPIHNLGDLAGRIMAFEHPDSFTSFFLPLQALRQAGMTLVPLDSPHQSVPADKVGYTFSRNERNNLLWVDKGIAAAGALNDGDWSIPDRLPAELVQRMRIIHRSPSYPRAFEMVTSTLEPEAREALQQALLSLDPERDRPLLQRYEKSSRITPLEAGDLDLLRSLEVETLP
ncbi:phosphate/phosphite/phosphonate ABC transporter substrate-binding protein [Marinobacterium sediminicola]|uniref:Phosphonate transport system substrate-binding protein n=1 Tax=Marinobacterium sediminicola TaxID=518898 RepID=A0ABY1S2Z5_9GAMM|nr:phosphate/phosphite/phosphonate ABC transporter substrate-binding protein [Marinobacterium sediminicola]ULG69285.1 phosphate/phosphite/phosphonate ABC transporter substrate-binding protein [Marinobacterium sediminicola]SMR77634.1 phosphonate transport system substrate-binding protein [Marinobacterium sediminicola]